MKAPVGSCMAKPNHKTIDHWSSLNSLSLIHGVVSFFVKCQMGQFELMKNKKDMLFLQEHSQDPFYKRKFAKCTVFYCSFVDYAKAELL